MYRSLRPPKQRIPSRESLDEARMAEAYDRISRLPPMVLLRRFAVARAVALVSKGSAADIGCGPGYLVLELARRAPQLQIVGVDLSAQMLISARKIAKRKGLAQRVTFTAGDARKLPFADGSLDLIVSSLSLHHWSEPTAGLNEVHRVLKPGGGFMVFDLRRDMVRLASMVVLLATRVFVPSVLKENNEPLGSRNAAYTPAEAAELIQHSQLRSGYVASGDFWFSIEGYNE